MALPFGQPGGKPAKKPSKKKFTPKFPAAPRGPGGFGVQPPPGYKAGGKPKGWLD